MTRKVIGEGWKSYLEGLRQVRRAGRSQVAMSRGGYPYAVAGPQRILTLPVRESTGGTGERD